MDKLISALIFCAFLCQIICAIILVVGFVKLFKGTKGNVDTNENNIEEEFKYCKCHTCKHYKTCCADDAPEYYAHDYECVDDGRTNGGHNDICPQPLPSVESELEDLKVWLEEDTNKETPKATNADKSEDFGEFIQRTKLKRSDYFEPAPFAPWLSEE